MKLKTIFIVLLSILAISCTKDNQEFDAEIEGGDVSGTYDDNAFTIPDWTAETHSKWANPNFDEVFDNTEVKRIDIVFTQTRWQSMLDNMTELYGTFRGGSTGPGNKPGGNTGPYFSDENPIFVPGEMYYNGKQWYRVGVRFKGNSSLRSSWQAGILKLSLKLDFDEFEDFYPQVENQRFYGFKKLSLKNNYDDKSFLREKVAAEIFEKAGLAVSHTAFYTVYIDHGDGPEYFGLYTLVEEVDNTVIATQFSDDSGNLYKPENAGASFINGSFNETDFEKKTNEEEGDWSDIKALFSVLHDNTRTENPEVWRSSLEALFDMEVFLRYLAVNTVMQNWDTYGLMTHNYFLYNNPDNNKLTWIPWDNNESLQEGKMGGALMLDFSDIQRGAWPLIEYIYADNHYKTLYDAYVQETIDGAFEATSIQEIYAQYAALIEPFVESEITGYTFLNNSGEFQQAIAQLHHHVADRASAVRNYLKEP